MEKPNHNIFESILIGTGGGYGESQVIHLGYGNWIIVDSCINPETKKSLPLEYLRQIGVDLANDVKLIVCTHWHDDHIRGISELLEECEKSEFCFAKTTDKAKFLRLIGLDSSKLKSSESVSSTSEFSKCLKLLSSRKATVKSAIEDKILLSIPNTGGKCEVIALSPSDWVMNEFDTEISELITNFGQSNRKIVTNGPNSKCVVLLLRVGEKRVLLGADLEVEGECDKSGWLRIVSNKNNFFDKKCSLFKIPHHGSVNGFHDRIWSELIEDLPIAKLTPWNKNSKLPKKEMLSLYFEKSSISTITSTFYSSKSKPKKRDKLITKMLRELKPSLSEVKYSYGITKCSTNLDKKDSVWCVECFGEGKIITSELINNYKIE